MDHSFNVEVARIYGLPAAVFIQNLYFWILKNEANGRHYYEGRNWTYNSLSALEKIFPYFSRGQIRTIIAKCEAAGAVIRGNFNKKGYDKTCWYALGDEVLQMYGGYAEINTSPMLKSTQPVLKPAHPCAETSTPIPDSKPYSKPDIESIGAKAPKPTHKRFEKPTVEDVKAYCQERHNSIDAERFVDYYEANGWMVGKSHMRDWRAAVRNWERRGGCSAAPKSQTRGSSASFNAMDLDNDIRPLPPVGQGRQQ